MNYKEEREHGKSDFPIELYHIYKNHPRYEMVCHWHMEDEILTILSGKLNIKLNENKYCAEEGDILFINSGTLHSAIPEGSGCVYECIVFNMDYLLSKSDICGSYIKRLINFSLFINEYIKSGNSEFHDTVKKLFAEMEKTDFGYELKVKGLLYQMMGIIFKEGLYNNSSLKNTQTEKRISILKEALAFIEENYNTQITLEKISSTAKMSPKYFCKFFKEFTGKTPVEYLINYRIEQACMELQNTDYSVTEIAYNCGFNDLSHFIKTFKNIKKVTPHKFRNNS